MRRTKLEAEETRVAILNAAIDVFIAEGVARASLDKIAKAADVTRGAIYWHFSNKIEIFDALHEQLHKPFIERVLEGLELSHDDPADQLLSICTDILTELDQDEQKRKLLTLFLLKCDYSGDFQLSKEKFLLSKQKTISTFATYFEKASAKGNLSTTVDPRLLGIALQSFIRGIVMEYLEAPSGVDIAKDGKALLKLLFAGIKAE
ncbi:TetR family transcriptional regulator [Glaciecola sp. 1036]|uniref:TetR family transcriptional regulator n=1 Tax=Alteromonadaceae TaxID=72275 RepID=UPI003CFC19AE